MSRRNIALVCFVLALLVPLAAGVANYVSASPVPWTAAALSVPWDQVPPNFQSVLLGYMKLAGAGLIGTALALGFLVFIPFRQGEAWALWAIGTVATVASLLACYGFLSMQQETGAAQPWYNPLISLVLVAVGVVLAQSHRRP